MKICISVAKKTITDFYHLMGIPGDANLPEDQKMRSLQTRIAAFDEGKTCSRCGGSGHYSFNLIKGTVCFKCNGTGKELIPKSGFNNALFDRLSEKVKAGRLKEYLEQQQILQKARKANNLQTKFLAEWQKSGISKAYDVHKCSDGKQPDTDIAKLVNQPIADFYNVLKTTVNELDNTIYEKTKNEAQRKERIQKISMLVAQLDAEYNSGLMLISEKVKLIPRLKEKWGSHNSEKGL